MQKIVLAVSVFELCLCTSIYSWGKYEALAREQRFEDFFPKNEFHRTFSSLDEAYDYVKTASIKFWRSVGNKNREKGLGARLVGPLIPVDAPVTVFCTYTIENTSAVVIFLVFSNDRAVSIPAHYLAPGYVYTNGNSQIQKINAFGKVYQMNYPVGWAIDQAFQYLKGSTPPPKGQKLMSFKEAIAGAVAEFEKRVQQGTAIGITKIDASLPVLSSFVTEELKDRFGSTKKFVIIESEPMLEDERTFQMSGMVDDESAVGIGHDLDAKVVITGTFDRFANFSQLRIRAIDVATAELRTTYSALIRNDDAMLADVIQSLQNVKVAVMTEEDLVILNRGRDYFASGKYNEAIKEFDTLLGVNDRVVEAYFCRGFAYAAKKDYDRAIENFTAALEINPNAALALKNRGVAYREKGEYDKALADFEAASRLDPSNQDQDEPPRVEEKQAPQEEQTEAEETPDGLLVKRGIAYFEKGDYDQAIIELTAALRINPNNTYALIYRGIAYGHKGDHEQERADLNAAQFYLLLQNGR